MRVVLIGCEYAGTTTLADGIQRWSHEVMGEGNGLVAFHDHWKIPYISGHPGLDDENLFTPEEQEQFLALTPKTKEMVQRYSITYHLTAGALRNPDYVSVGLHIENAIYGALYFGYYTGEQAWMRRAISGPLRREHPGVRARPAAGAGQGFAGGHRPADEGGSSSQRCAAGNRYRSGAGRIRGRVRTVVHAQQVQHRHDSEDS